MELSHLAGVIAKFAYYEKHLCRIQIFPLKTTTCYFEYEKQLNSQDSNTCD